MNAHSIFDGSSDFAENAQCPTSPEASCEASADHSPAQASSKRQLLSVKTNFGPRGELRTHAALVEVMHFTEVDMQYDDTLTARIHRKEEARSKKAKTESEFSPGRSIFVTEKRNPFATFGGVVDAVTNAGRVIALIDIFGRMTPVQFEPRQLTPAA